MFGLFKKRKKGSLPSVRDTLFGDMPLGQWCGEPGQGEPWSSFAAARDWLDGGDRESAMFTLRSVLAQPDLEPRHYAQAWHFLRGLGAEPPLTEARDLYGVVVEIAFPQGLDLLAAYADLSARYYNYSGAGVIWDRPDSSLDSAIQRVLDTASTVSAEMGPWEGERPPAPGQGQTRLNLLTPGGLMFGQAELDVLAADPLAGPLVSAATALMQALIQEAER